MERLRRFWLTGTCNPKKEEKKASEPLAPEQFLSLFFILMFGVFLAICLMGAEHAYIKWIRGRVAKTDKAGCCALISKVSYVQKCKFCLKSRFDISAFSLHSQLQPWQLCEAHKTLIFLPSYANSYLL